MKNQNFRVWANNRARTPIIKFQSWRQRPLGAVVRAIEAIFLGAPLQQILRANNDIDEIRHLLPNLREIDSEHDLLISQARVSTRNGLTRLESGHIIARHLNSHTYLSGNLFDEVRTLLRRTPERIGFDFVFVLPKQDYFYHFLIDFMPQILRLNIKFADLLVIVNRDESAFVIEYLEHHGTRYQKTSAKTIEASSIVVPNFTSQNLRVTRSLLGKITFEDNHSFVTAPKIAFLRFRGSRYDRDFERRLEQHLTKKGFKIFDPDTLSISVQIKLFSDATEIFAIHGGVLANLIYSKEGTIVHEIFTHPYRTLFFQAMSKELGFNYSSSEASDYDFDSLP